jgi:hypothetical protein
MHSSTKDTTTTYFHFFVTPTSNLRQDEGRNIYISVLHARGTIQETLMIPFPQPTMTQNGNRTLTECDTQW